MKVIHIATLTTQARQNSASATRRASGPRTDRRIARRCQQPAHWPETRCRLSPRGRHGVRTRRRPNKRRRSQPELPAHFRIEQLARRSRSHRLCQPFHRDPCRHPVAPGAHGRHRPVAEPEAHRTRCTNRNRRRTQTRQTNGFIEAINGFQNARHAVSFALQPCAPCFF
jgi:hypothetical protein